MTKRGKQAEQAPTQADESPLPPSVAVLQDWTPLGRSLEYRMAQVAWLQDGAALMLDGELPTAGHDSGTIAAHGAQVLAAWCEERVAADDLPAEIVVVELGMGTGAHLHGLLESFRRLCLAASRDWYARVVAFATDISPSVVALAANRQVFASHGARVRLGLMDVRSPGLFREYASDAVFDLRGQIHALWAHYLLDALPVDIYREVAGHWEIAALQTLVPDVAAWQRVTGVSLAEGQALAADEAVMASAKLAAGQLLTELRVRTLAFDWAEHPDAAELQRAAQAQRVATGTADEVFLHHPAGAMRVLPLLRDALAPMGFAVLRDVGLVSAEAAVQARMPARFGRTLAMPVSFVQLDGWFAAAHPETPWLAPDGDGVRDHATRLLTRRPLPQTAARFVAQFAGPALDAARTLADAARQQTEPTAALEAWRQAALAEPDDWLTLQEAAEVVLNVGQLPLALAIAARGLELNPTTSAALWRLAGTAHALMGDATEAELALRQGLAIAPNDGGLHLALARLAADLGEFPTTLRHIGEALAGDRMGVWRETALALLDATLRADEARRQTQQAAWKGRFD